MTTSVTIYAYPGNVNSFKSLIAGQYSGVKVSVAANFNMGVDNKTPEFLKKNPTGQVPTADTPDGPLFESNSIAKYVARKGNDKGLYGPSEYDASAIDQWLEFFRSRLEIPLSEWVSPILGYAQFNEDKHKEAKNKVQENLKILDNHLAGTGFMVGKRVTLADICIFVSFWNSIKYALTNEYLDGFANFKKWYLKLAAENQFKTVVGDLKIAAKEGAPGEFARR